MLTQIHIRHLATIEEVQLEIPSATTVITGETGVGKSIILEAIELALGDRASANVVRAGQEKAEINLSFNIQKLPEVAVWLRENDLDPTAHECILRRVIFQDGRSRCYINGITCPQHVLRELATMLLQMHGQYEQQNLLKSEKQREILDYYAGHLSLVHEVKNLALQWRSLQTEIEQLREKTRASTQHEDFLRFQLNELETLKLQAGEWQALEADQRKLAHAEELLRHLNQVLQILTESEENNVVGLVNDALKSLQTVHVVETKTKDWGTSLQRALVEINDTENEIRNYLDRAELDPDKLQQVEQRLQQIYHLARKYKVQPEMLLNLQQDLQQQLSLCENSGERLLELEKNLATIASNYQLAAEKLSTSRAKSAIKLAKEITKIIQTLSLPHAQLQVELSPENSEFSVHGSEKIQFLIKTNPGHSFQPLAKIASGGELSRISLAVHLVTAGQRTLAALVFDEVDTGISGAIAEKVGKLIRQLGETYQVLCVTHLPQVAAQGHHHLLVEKKIRQQQPYTEMRILNLAERTAELARMLSGEKITDAVLKHAKEILVGI